MNTEYELLNCCDVFFCLLDDGRNVIDLNIKSEKRKLPVGIAIDRCGYLYVGVYRGSCLLKIDPR